MSALGWDGRVRVTFTLSPRIYAFFEARADRMAIIEGDRTRAATVGEYIQRLVIRHYYTAREAEQEVQP